jgi:hypothetical protein
VQNNPIYRMDPLGALDDNYDIYEGGRITKKITTDPTNTYTYHNNDGSTVDLGTYKVVNGINNEELVEIPGNGISYSQEYAKKTNYLNEDAFANFLGASYSYMQKTGYKTKVNQFMTQTNQHSGKYAKKICIDLQYIGVKGISWKTNPRTSDDNVDAEKSFQYAKHFLDWKFGENSKWSIIAQDKTGNALFKGYANDSPHKDHFHIQGYTNTIKIIK